MRARSRPRPTTRASSGVDLVIEAVFEDLALKQRDGARGRGGEAARRSSPPTPRRSRSRKIAEASTRPENVVGMHYFSPGPQDAAARGDRDAGRPRRRSIATAVALGKKQGKTVIVVNDGVGFYTSRILGPYMNEAALPARRGRRHRRHRPGARRRSGFPVGPITLLDEVGIDVGAHVGQIMLDGAFGERMAPPARWHEARRRRPQGAQERARASTSTARKKKGSASTRRVYDARCPAARDARSRCRAGRDPDALLAPDRERGDPLPRRGHPPQRRATATSARSSASASRRSAAARSATSTRSAREALLEKMEALPRASR